MKYIFLFPGLALFSLALLAIGGMGFPLEFEIFGRKIHELESLTISGSKSLSNLIEIIIASAIGVLASVALRLNWQTAFYTKQSTYFLHCYLLVLCLYFLIPALPE